MLDMPYLKLTKGKAKSTDADTLDWLAMQFDTPILHKIKAARQIKKVTGTYLNKLKVMVDPKGFVHPDLYIGGTVTGRPTDELFLTLPRRTKNPYTGAVRKLLICGPDEVFWFADYDQMELRVLACEAQEPLYQKMFLEGGDPHALMADALYTTAWRDYDNAKEWRTRAKNYNFAEKYGAGLKKLAETAKVSIAQVKKAKSSFVAIEAWKDKTLATAFEDEQLTTCFGRVRRFPLITTKLWNKSIKRQVVNFPIQSIANSLAVRSAIKMNNDVGPYVVLMQHDSIEAIIPRKSADIIAARMVNIMENYPTEIYSDYVPFKAGYGLGNSWGEAEENADG
jgi:DNA polymerase-1